MSTVVTVMSGGYLTRTDATAAQIAALQAAGRLRQVEQPHRPEGDHPMSTLAPPGSPPLTNRSTRQMAKKTCIATSFSSPHEFEPGTEKERKRMEADCWEVCGRPRKHKSHGKDDS